ncbi:hypothetical protein [Bradyrhizobium prioriisuperbiae]|uniref:hypothetical protein n=1 Tax=Bradyrhizobium prioriisuperbiae TaxID=2854389 RepID=UPI0028F0FE6A|nr:hypothetical protein [Bradyrhizobium prioritasuperba]
MQRGDRIDDGLPGGRGSKLRVGLSAAGIVLDLLTSLNLKRYNAAEAMLRDDLSGIGPDGADTTAMRLAVNKRTWTPSGG